MEHNIQSGPPPRDPHMQAHLDPSPIQPGPAPPPLPPVLPVAAFPSRPYAPDGACPGAGFPVLGLTLMTGVGVAIIMGLCRQWIYLVFLFPGAMGIAVGALGTWAVSVGKLRNPLLAGLLGLLGGCIAYVGMHYVGYLIFVGRGGFGIGFTTFVDILARQGVTFNSTSGAGRPGSGMNLGYVGSYIYWGAELAFVCGISFGLMYARARQPFCRACGSWKTEHHLGALYLPRTEAAAALESGELARLANPNHPPGEGQIDVRVSWCPYCLDAAPVDARLDQTVPHKKGVKIIRVGYRTFPGDALPVFRSLFLGRVAPPGPPGVA